MSKFCEVGKVFPEGVPTPTGLICVVCFEPPTETVRINRRDLGTFKMCDRHAKQTYGAMAMAKKLANPPHGAN